jgi:porin
VNATIWQNFGAPPDRNLIDLYVDAGIEFIGPSDKRPDDKFGIAAGYAHISRRAQQLDNDYRNFVNPDWPQRSFEGLLTAVYQYQIRDGWTVQPTFQYIIHPGGGRQLRRELFQASRSRMPPFSD